MRHHGFAASQVVPKVSPASSQLGAICAFEKRYNSARTRSPGAAVMGSMGPKLNQSLAQDRATWEMRTSSSGPKAMMRQPFMASSETSVLICSRHVLAGPPVSAPRHAVRSMVSGRSRYSIFSPLQAMNARTKDTMTNPFVGRIIMVPSARVRLGQRAVSALR